MYKNPLYLTNVLAMSLTLWLCLSHLNGPRGSSGHNRWHTWDKDAARGQVPQSTQVCHTRSHGCPAASPRSVDGSGGEGRQASGVGGIRGRGIGKSTMVRGEAHTTQTAHRRRWRAAGGGFHNSAAAGMCRRRLSWQGAPVHPSSALPCSPHIVLPGRQVGGGAPPAYFSAQPLGPKLQTPVAQSSTGPPLLSLAL